MCFFTYVLQEKLTTVDEHTNIKVGGEAMHCPACLMALEGDLLDISGYKLHNNAVCISTWFSLDDMARAERMRLVRALNGRVRPRGGGVYWACRRGCKTLVRVRVVGDKVYAGSRLLGPASEYEYLQQVA